MRRLTWVFVLFAVLAMACGAPEASVEDQARAIAARTWSPYCPGRLLVDCTTPQADELRDDITARLAGGQSEAEVIEWIRANHGDAALAAPAPGGSGMAIWLVPAAIFVAGAIIVVGLLRRWRRAPTRIPPPEQRRAVASDEALAWLRAEVERES